MDDWVSFEDICNKPCAVRTGRITSMSTVNTTVSTGAVDIYVDSGISYRVSPETAKRVMLAAKVEPPKSSVSKEADVRALAGQLRALVSVLDCDGLADLIDRDAVRGIASHLEYDTSIRVL